MRPHSESRDTSFGSDYVPALIRAWQHQQAAEELRSATVATRRQETTRLEDQARAELAGRGWPVTRITSALRFAEGWADIDYDAADAATRRKWAS